LNEDSWGFVVADGILEDAVVSFANDSPLTVIDIVFGGNPSLGCA
jgi:hypothetical protein